MLAHNSPKILIGLAATALLSGCASMPELGDSPELLRADSIEAGQSLASTSPAGWPEENWWTAYGDPQLNALIEEGLANSPDIVAAEARFQRALGLARQAGADLWPQLGLTGQATLDKQSYVNGFPKEYVPKGWLDRGLVAAEASLDIDLWGRNRAALSAAMSDADVAALGERQARLTLAGGIADVYAELAGLYARRDVFDRLLGTHIETRQLVNDRVAAGIDTRGDQRLAEANEQASRAELAAIDEEIALRRNQLAALIGAGPDRGLAIERPALLDEAPHGLPSDVTTALIARRVDVAAALAGVEAASDRVDVAKADFFPAIRIDALIGFQALGLGNLTSSDALYGSVGPAIDLPIFDGGRRAGQYRVNRADYDAAVADYNSTVLTAYREVADVVTSRNALDERLAHGRAAVEAAEDAYRIARLRYQGGLSNYLDLLPVETRMLEARSDLADLEMRAFTLDVALVRALGGGFETGRSGEAGAAQED